jgi:hypothetical protein
MAEQGPSGFNIHDAAAVGFMISTRLLSLLVEKDIMTSDEAVALLDELIKARPEPPGVVRLLAHAKKGFRRAPRARSH